MTTLAAALLIGAMVSIMAARVGGPFGRAIPGAPLREHRLNVRERLVLHRHSIYALGAVLLLGAATGAIPRPVEIAGVLGAFAVVLGLPAVNRLTREGIGLNGVVSRPWSEFAGVEETGRGLRLRGKPGLGDFSVVCLGRESRRALRRIAAERVAEKGPGDFVPRRKRPQWGLGTSSPRKRNLPQ
jgi:hypothetical protein